MSIETRYCEVDQIDKYYVRKIVEPQPKHSFVEGCAYLTIGMDKSKDGQVFYDADGVKPGVPYEPPVSPGQFFEDNEVIGVSTENRDGLWYWLIEVAL